MYMLLPHPNAESAVTLGGRLVADAEYKAAASSFRSLPATDPPYVRRESTLMLGFESFPGVEAPKPAAPSRLFELRTCERSAQRGQHQPFKRTIRLQPVEARAVGGGVRAAGNVTQ